jgi:alpha-ketoglutarate-dependent taurine dioxygenase
VRDVSVDPSIGNDVIASRNTRELRPHTEGYESIELPPRYVALWCVHPAEGPGGETTLADGYALLATFSYAERVSLARPEFVFRTGAGLARQGHQFTATSPVLADHDGTPVLRFSHQELVTEGNDLAGAWVSRGEAFFDRHHAAVKIGRGDLLIWDNWRMLHARNAFTDPRRHLRRVLLAAD